MESVACEQCERECRVFFYLSNLCYIYIYILAIAISILVPLTNEYLKYLYPQVTDIHLHNPFDIYYGFLYVDNHKCEYLFVIPI